MVARVFGETSIAEDPRSSFFRSKLFRTPRSFFLYGLSVEKDGFLLTSPLRAMAAMMKVTPSEPLMTRNYTEPSFLKECLQILLTENGCPPPSPL
jgi:hypothetical protein